jgi:prephenate dehydrogenase
MKSLEEAEFTIVGTGLMGASLALALRGKVNVLRGVDHDVESRRIATPHFDQIGAYLTDEMATADVIILATPIKAILRLLETLSTLATPGTLIIDLGSSKQKIVAAMDLLPDHLLAVGGHPMCGKETSGPAAAEGTLYQDRPFVLCRTQRTTEAAFEFAAQMVSAIRAHCIELTAEQHDRAVATISHLPYLLSAGLVGTTIDVSQNDNTPWQLASSGYRDTSRLAGSDITMMGDTLLTNREAVLDTLTRFRRQLDNLETALQSSDEPALRAILKEAREARSNWWEQWGSPPERRSVD